MNCDVTITPATPAQLDRIMEIEQGCFGVDAFSRRQMSYLLTRASGEFYAACCDGKLAGYLSFITSRRHNSGRIYSVAVAAEFRGSGIASELVDRAVEVARSQGLRAVFLEVAVSNTAAISLYSKKGFVKRGIKADYYHDGSDAFSMELRLD